MGFFSKDFNGFFKDLAKNNNKEWFNANRKRYETSVKKPFYAFVDDLIERIAVEDPSVQIQAKDAVMRINRDIRFSPDKTPYNVHYGAIISPAGRKDKSIPGFFIRFSPEDIGIYGGAHGIDKDQLQRIRTAIAADLNGFKKVLADKAFTEKYGTLLGEQNKRIPKEFEEAATKQPLIANKQFYYTARLAPKLITDESLSDTLMDYWRAARPVKDYLARAIAG